MNEDKNHINYSAMDIEKYHRGELSPAAMHAMEMAALDDPFLADAMEGYMVASGKNSMTKDNIPELKQRLAERIAKKDRWICANPAERRKSALDSCRRK